MDLYEAAWDGDYEAVEKFLSNKTVAEANLDDDYGRTALWIATQEGHLPIVEKLISLVDSGVEVDKADVNGETPLIVAAKRGHLSIVTKLVEENADVNRRNYEGESSLMLSLKMGHNAIAEKLILNGADVNACGPFGTPLHICCLLGNLQLVEKLIAFGANIDSRNSRNESPLIVASRLGHVGIIEQLVSKGAELGVADSLGITALLAASANGNFQAVKRLRLHGADVNRTDHDGRNAYFAAYEAGYIPLADWLQTTADFSLLHIAVDIRDSDAVEELISKNANVFDSNNHLHVSPLNLAMADWSNCNMSRNQQVLWLVEKAIGPWDVTIDQSTWPVAWKNGAMALISVLAYYGRQLEEEEFPNETVQLMASLPDDLFFKILSFTSRNWFDE